MGLPAVVEELLVDVATDGFTLYCCGSKTAPNALVAAYEWKHYVDLLTIRDFDLVTAARVPKRGAVDIFAPEVVVWAYLGPSQQALRALLELVHPAHPDAPTAEYPAPAGLHVPRAQQRPMTIRPPSPGRAVVRADRLVTAMRGDHAASSWLSGCQIPGWSPVSERPPTLKLPAASRHQPVHQEGRCTMPADTPQAARNRWCDVEGTRIALFSWVEQVAEHPEHGALFSRLHQQGQVLGRGPEVLYVRFAGERHLISVPPELLRLLPHEPDER
ncbi:MAG: hypothetical protein ACRDRY_21395 [Pseudonocardiaceae bacterium]